MANPTQQVPTESIPFSEEKVYWPADPTKTSDVTYAGEMMGMRYDTGYAEHFDDSAPKLFLGTKEQITSRFQSDTPATNFKYLIRRPKIFAMPLNTSITTHGTIPGSIGSPAYAADSGHVQLSTSGLTNNNLAGMVVDISRSYSTGGGTGGVMSLTTANTTDTVYIAPPVFGALLGLVVQGFQGAGSAGAAAPDLVVTAGNGAASVATTGTVAGGGGANFTLTTGTGGAASSTAGAAGGAGGGFNVTYGAGGAAAGTSAGGAGGGTTLTLGVGGANSKATSGGAGGAGGSLTVTGAAGGASVSGAGGVGSGVSITLGAGGAATAGTGNGGAGGSFTVVAGAGGTSSGGAAGAAGTINLGNTTVPGKVIVGGTLTAGGLLGNAVQVGTSGPLIYSGSGAPSISAAVKGSIYLRTDGSSTSTRLYVATDTAGTWTGVTTGA